MEMNSVDSVPGQSLEREQALDGSHGVSPARRSAGHCGPSDEPAP